MRQKKVKRNRECVCVCVCVFVKDRERISKGDMVKQKDIKE